MAERVQSIRHWLQTEIWKKYKFYAELSQIELAWNSLKANKKTLSVPSIYQAIQETNVAL